MEREQDLDNILLEKESNNNLKTKQIILTIASIVLLFLITLGVMRALNSSTPIENEFENIENRDIQAIQKEKTLAENDAYIPPVEQNNTPINNTIEEEITPKKESIVVEEQVAVKAEPVYVTPKTKPVTKVVKSNIPSGHYIQVGSFSAMKPKQAFLNKIKKSGFKYHKYNTIINGRNILKIVIGPYRTKNEARADIALVKASIIKGAFIIKINN